MNKRYRLVTETRRNGYNEEHVSSVILTEDEAVESIAIESGLMDMAGWVIEKQSRDYIQATLVTPSGETHRTITFRESTHEQDEL